MDIPPRIQPGDPRYQPILDRVDDFRPHYDRAGQPISLRQWAEVHNREEYVRLAQDYLDDGHIWVSTAWLGLNHSFGDGPPLIFETMAFIHLTEEQVEEKRRKWSELGWSDHDFPWEDCGEMRRYTTEEEAREGHHEVVDSLRLKIEIFEDALGDDG